MKFVLAENKKETQQMTALVEKMLSREKEKFIALAVSLIHKHSPKCQKHRCPAPALWRAVDKSSPIHLTAFFCDAHRTLAKVQPVLIEGAADIRYMLRYAEFFARAKEEFD